MVVVSLIFLADTKIIFAYNFVVPLINDLIVNIILDYFKSTVHNLFIITTNLQGGVL